jgi:SAM-dependent methyltransferase
MKDQGPNLLPRHEDEVGIIEGHLNAILKNGDATVQILEAGCGRRWDLRNLSFPFRLTGIDLDKEALRLRKEVARDLDEAIHGDLTKADFSPEQFDVVYSSYVLEHLTNAEQALDKFMLWLRKGGALVIRVPDGESAYGTITRLSPHWFHVFYYRWILGNKNAGKPGYPPYETTLEPVVSIAGLERFAKDRGLEVVARYRTAVETRNNLRGRLVRLAIKLVEWASFGRLSASHCTLTYIFRKPLSNSPTAA